MNKLAIARVALEAAQNYLDYDDGSRAYVSEQVGAAIRALPLDDLQTEGDAQQALADEYTKELDKVSQRNYELRMENARLRSGDVVAAWQQRCNWMSWEPATKLVVEAMKAEIAELRAALAKVQEQP